MSAQPAPRPVLILRRAVPADLESIMVIEKDSFRRPWPASVIVRDLELTHNCLYRVAQLGDEVVAYLGGWLYEGKLHVGSVATACAYRRRGLAEILMLDALRVAAARGADRVVLEYRVSNRPAARLYAKLGFQQVRLHKHYYLDSGEDAVEVLLSPLRGPQIQKRLAALTEKWLQNHDYDLQVAAPESG